MSKTWLITGCSSGFGKELTEALPSRCPAVWAVLLDQRGLRRDHGRRTLGAYILYYHAHWNDGGGTETAPWRDCLVGQGRQHSDFIKTE